MDRTNMFIRLCGMAALVLLVFPIYGLLSSGASIGTVLLALAAVGVFAAIYVSVWLHATFQTARHTLYAVLGLTVLAVGFNIVLPAALRWAVLFVYVVGAAGFGLLGRKGIAAVGAATLLALATLLVVRATLPPQTQRELPLAAPNALLQLVLVGLGAAGGRRLIETTTELHAAREALAHLAVEQERHRFARDLHDLLGHSLSLIVLKSELANRLLPQRPADAAAEMIDIELAAREALRDVRAAVSGYRQPTLAAELREARTTLAAAGIACQIDTSASVPQPAHTLFAWVVREGVTNVVRHSHATQCIMQIGYEHGTAHIEIVDDGGGNTVTAHGHGLAGLRERVAAGGGHLEAGPKPNGGFRLCVTLPVAAPTHRIAGHEQTV